MSELFDEVNEDVRREQLKKLWDKYSLVIIAAGVLLIAAIGGWRGYQFLEAKKAQEASTAFERAADLSDAGKPAEAEAAFAKVATEATGGYRVLARLRAAAEQAKANPAEAVKQYDAIAADGSVGTAERDLARIRAAALLVDREPYPALSARLDGSAQGTGTFRHSARELLALSAMRASDAVAARRWLDMLADDAETPAAIRSRAEALQALLPPVAKS